MHTAAFNRPLCAAVQRAPLNSYIEQTVLLQYNSKALGAVQMQAGKVEDVVLSQTKGTHTTHTALDTPMCCSAGSAFLLLHQTEGNMRHNTTQ